MPKYSRSHERAECAKISRGLWESLFGLIFSWLPLVGLVLSVSGFCRQAVRMTEAHKTRRFFSMAFASVVLVVAIGGLVSEAYLYSRDPDIMSKTGLWIWQKVTGQEALPGTGDGEIMPTDEGVLPDETSVPDEYHTADGQVEEGDVPVTSDGQVEEGDVPVSGDTQMEEGDVPVSGDTQMEEGDVPPSEGDFQDNIDFSEDNSDETGGLVTDAPESTLPPIGDLLKSYGVTVG
jgi:hypothetical protein